MRRKECERDAAFAWEVLRHAVYATLSMVDADGMPYATPVNAVGDEVYQTLYFHCAGAGERWDILKDGAPVCSPICLGLSQVVTDEGEKTKAMLLLCTAFDPKGMARFDEAMSRCTAQVIKIVPETITGKEHEMHQEPKSHGCKGE